MRKLLSSALLLIFLASFPSYSDTVNGNEKIHSFSKAKKYLKNVIFSGTDRQVTFYCGCRYDKKFKIDYRSCGYIPGRERKRAARVEWEHIVPAAAFGKNLKEWKYGSPECVDRRGKHFKGRKCASKMNKTFQLMQADMYNLVPAVGEINAVRSDFSYGEIQGETRNFGKCDFETDGQTAEPADNIKGDIARVYFYMNASYPGFGIVNQENRAMFEKWDKMDPPDENECRKAAEIENIQGNPNPVLKKLCTHFQP